MSTDDRIDTSLPETKTLRLEDIHPYENNPRRIPDEAIAAVRTSIEKYGYQQPIVVDSAHVIIAGHTRYAALQAMGVQEVPVYVSHMPADKANAFRLADNRLGENSDWDHDKLVMELREFEQDLLDQFFPDVDLELSQIEGAQQIVTEADTVRAASKVAQTHTTTAAHTTTVICPACYEGFPVTTSSLPGLTRLDLETLEAAAHDGSTAEQS